MARTLADPQRLAQAALVLTSPFGMTSGSGFEEGVLDLYEEALAGLPDEPSPERARLLSAIVGELQWRDDEDRRRRLGSEALEMARATADGPTLLAVTDRSLGHPRWARPVRREWVSIQQEALAAAEQEDDPEALLLAQLRMVGPVAAVGEVAAARAHLEDAERHADGLRLPRSLTADRLPAGHAGGPGRRFRARRAPRGGGHRVRAVRRVTDSFNGQTAGGRARLHPQRPGTPRRDDPPDGGAVPDHARSAGLEMGAVVPPWRAANRVEEARVHFDWLVADDFARVPSDTTFPVTLCGLGRLCLRLGVGEATAAAIYDRLLPHAGTFGWTFATVSQPHDLGLAGAAWAAGERDVAERHFAASVELCERAGARPHLAWTHHDWAYALAESGRVIEAKEHAEATRVIAEDIGMLGPDGPMCLVRKLLEV